MNKYLFNVVYYCLLMQAGYMHNTANEF